MNKHLSTYSATGIGLSSDVTNSTMGDHLAGRNTTGGSQTNPSRKRRSNQGQDSQQSKQPKITFSEDQKSILLRAFNENPVFTKERKAELSTATRLSAKQIEGWRYRQQQKVDDEVFQIILADAQNDLTVKQLTSGKVPQFEVMENMINILITLYIDNDYKLNRRLTDHDRLMPHILAFLGKSASTELVMFIFDCISRKFKKGSCTPSDDVNIVIKSTHPFLMQLSQDGIELLEFLLKRANKQSATDGAVTALNVKLERFREHVEGANILVSALSAMKKTYLDSSSESSLAQFRQNALPELTKLIEVKSALLKECTTLMKIVEPLKLHGCKKQHTIQSDLYKLMVRANRLSELVELQETLLP